MLQDTHLLPGDTHPSRALSTVPAYTVQCTYLPSGFTIAPVIANSKNVQSAGVATCTTILKLPHTPLHYSSAHLTSGSPSTQTSMVTLSPSASTPAPKPPTDCYLHYVFLIDNIYLTTGMRNNHWTRTIYQLQL